jgi:outer membrane protein TolC
MFAELDQNMYDLKFFIDQGLKHSIEIKKEFIKNNNSRDNHRNAIYDFLPDASVSGSGNFSYKNPSDYARENAGIHGSSSHTFSSGISVGKSFTSTDQTIFGYLQSCHDQNSREMEFESIQKSLSFRILNDFMTILKLQKSVEINRKNLELQEKVHSQTELLYQTERKSLLDFQQSKINLLDAKINLSDVELSLKQARESFFNFLMLEDSGSKFVEPSFDSVSFAPEYQTNLNLAINEVSKKKYKLQLLQNKIGLFPTVSLNLNWNMSASETYEKDLLETDRYGSSYGWNLNVSYPIFSFLDQHTSYRIQKRNYKSFLLDYDDAKRDHKLKFKHLMEEYNTLSKTYSLALQKKELAKENLKLAEEKYSLGSISLIDLDDSRIDALNSDYSASSKYYELIQKQEEINLHISK